MGKHDYHQLRMDNYVPPDQRLDAFPSISYATPHTYLPDTITLKHPVGSDVIFIAGERSVHVHSGDVLFLAPYQTYSEHPMQPGGTIYNVVIRPSKVEFVLPYIFETQNPIQSFLKQCTEENGPIFFCVKTGQPSMGEEVFPSLAQYCISSREHNPYELMMWEARLEQFPLRILLEADEATFNFKASQSQSELLSQVMGYVQRNLASATLEDVARRLGWSASHLSRYIKRQTGRTFSAIVQVLRLDEAVSLLRSTDLPIEEIMTRVGYTGKAHFYEIFLSRFGMTPAKIRGAFPREISQRL